MTMVNQEVSEMIIDRTSVEPLSFGAAAMAGGGGGDLYQLRAMLDDLLEDGATAQLVTVDEMSETDEAAPFALIGTPYALSESLLNRAQAPHVFGSAHLRARRPDVIMPYETSGVNLLYPLAVSVALSVPILDADLVGQGALNLDTTILQLDEIDPISFILCDSYLRSVVVTKIGDLSIERSLRPIVTDAMGSIATLSTSSLSQAFLRAHACRGSVSRCLELGELLAAAAGADAEQLQNSLVDVGGRLLESGRISERIASRDAHGARHVVTVAPSRSGGAGLRIELRDKYHLAVQSGLIVASMPDIIVVLSAMTGRPLSTEEAIPGKDVHVIALPSETRWISERGLAMAGPRAAGYNVDYVGFRDAEQVMDG